MHLDDEHATTLPVQVELTPRQQRILNLLQAGKVNKEVARELDIGLGTVKQHIVAIFKKLKVRNRTAAVFRNQDLHQVTELIPAAQPAGIELTRRPCVVLSLGLSGPQPAPIIRAFYGVLAALASTHEAIFLTRQGGAGEIIFGVQRVTEYDVALALQTAASAYKTLLEAHPELRGQVHGCLTAGLALASMHRFGGWTGEAIVSAAIASARELTQVTANGMFTCDQAVIDLCSAFGVSGALALSKGVAFEDLSDLHWTGTRPHYPLVGRKPELSRLLASLDQAVADGHGCLVLLEGEMGMGKSRLCHELFESCRAKKVAARYFCSLPPVLESAICDVNQGVLHSVDDALTILRSPLTDGCRLMLLDDFNLIRKERQSELLQAAAEASALGRMVVFAGRRDLILSPPLDAIIIRLLRMPLRDMRTLIRHTLNISPGKKQSAREKTILNTATGVPLFAVEMARQPNLANLALSLLVAVHARLDKLRLDSSLLRVVAEQPVAISMTMLAEAFPKDAQLLHQQVDRAVACGVIERGPDGTISFTHPMIHRVIGNSDMK